MLSLTYCRGYGLSRERSPLLTQARGAARFAQNTLSREGRGVRGFAALVVEKILSVLERLGCFSLRSALASIWRIPRAKPGAKG